MREKVDKIISVESKFLGDKKKLNINKINWNNRDYLIEKLGMYYKQRRGCKLYHNFFVYGGGLSFKLVLEADSLIWKLEEISDGLSE